MQAAESADQQTAPPPPPQAADWNKVYELATEAIATHSKDLWITAWLIESLARLHGFAGLRDGFRLTRELVDRYWDGIHPRPDEDGYATTVAQLTGLNGDESDGALLAPIDRIPITPVGDTAAMSSADYKTAVDLDKLDPDKRAARLASGAVSMEMFDKRVRETSAEFFRGLLEDVQQAIDEFYKLEEVLGSRCKSPEGASMAPPTSAIRGAMADVRDRIQTVAQPVLGSTSEEGGESGTGAATDESGSAATGKGMTRDQAFRQLLQVASFFRRTEPHSPVSYALEQAVRWGKMGLPELLAELISERGVRDDLFRRMGIPEPKEPGSE
jgi:type VI secretion system protein ImpA